MANMETVQQLEYNIVVKEETIDGEYEPLPTQCQGQQMATVKVESDVASVTTQPVDEVIIKEEIEIGPTEFLPQYLATEVSCCKVEPGTSGSKLSLCYNASRDDVTSNKEALRESSRCLDISHTGEKPFACDLCLYKCKRKSGLVAHMRKHTGEKPFACDLCLYKCKRKSGLVVHIRKHTGEKPFACDLCLYKCKIKSALVIHKRTHTGEKPFACDLCSYKCKRKRYLVNHKHNHTGEKPFACDLCLYKCKKKSTLVIHKRTHTGEKRFNCHLCSYKSNQKGPFDAHICASKYTHEKPFVCLKTYSRLHKR